MKQLIFTMLAKRIFVCWILLQAGAGVAASIPSWDSVFKELASELVTGDTSLDQLWTKSAYLRQLVVTGNTLSFREIIAIEENPDLLKTCAYFAFKEINPVGSQVSGLDFILYGDHTNKFYYSIVLSDIVSSVPNNSEIASALVAAFRKGPIKHSNASTLIMAIPVDTLRVWFDGAQLDLLLPSYGALITNRLLAEASRRKEPPSNRMIEMLNVYATIPGFPRLVFALNADSDHPLFEQSLLLVLEDDGIDEIMLHDFVHARASIIGELIDLNDLRISETRKAFIKSTLADASKRKLGK